jgi:hypothetical protein
MLPKRFLKRVDRRRGGKAFGLHRHAGRAFLRTDEVLCIEVSEDVLLAPPEAQWVVRDRRTIAHQRGTNVSAEAISRAHGGS